ncbi:response regulator transcription factor [Aquibacillus rhizosphaerae]|uniref:Response regulator transcription factor n=1 Tax=Aquibacillus rhizosphaerae TaxID=3051431 RepID=A0ABT7L051_9BACI|nr:response regulator transcription factor [Aquibacillus sp. LR5S19]MDL4839114.1 response regulator transcription factor [Aquibacillus sp. LR5S19]
MLKHTVLVGEYQMMFRDIIANSIKEMTDFKVIAKVSTGKSVVHFIEKTEVVPSICLLDLHMPEMNGFQCTDYLKDNYPNVKVVLLTAYDDEKSLEKVIAAGADGYIMKNSSLEHFKQVITCVANGYFIAPQKLVSKFSKRLADLKQLEIEGSPSYILDSLDKKIDLNEKEMKLIQLVNKGWSNQMIAEQLQVSEGTVKNYLSKMYNKLNVRRRTELMQLFSVKRSS